MKDSKIWILHNLSDLSHCSCKSMFLFFLIWSPDDLSFLFLGCEVNWFSVFSIKWNNSMPWLLVSPSRTMCKWVEYVWVLFSRIWRGPRTQQWALLWVAWWFFRRISSNSFFLFLCSLFIFPQSIVHRCVLLWNEYWPMQGSQYCLLSLCNRDPVPWRNFCNWLLFDLMLCPSSVSLFLLLVCLRTSRSKCMSVLNSWFQLQSRVQPIAVPSIVMNVRQMEQLVVTVCSDILGLRVL